MSKTRKWHVRAIHLAVALAMTLGLLMVPAVAAPAEPEAAASPAFAPTCGSLESGIYTGGTLGAAEWSTTQKHTGTYSGKLTSHTANLSYGAARVPYGGTLTAFSTIAKADMVFWMYWTKAGCNPYAALYLDTDDDGVADLALLNKGPAAGTIPLAINTWCDTHPHGDAADWHVYDYDAATGVIDGSGVVLCDDNTYDSNDWKSLAAWAALVCVPADGTFGDAEVLCVAQMFGGNPDCGGDPVGVAYVDEIIIDDVTYGMEPCYELEPDIAYNVKTADETFTMMDVCGEVDPDLVSNWIVTKGAGEGEVSVVAGGNTDVPDAAPHNYITVRMVTAGDCIITADVAGILNAADAEKKWGEIYCTELVKAAAVDHDYVVTETVKASFLEVVLPHVADNAKVDWWLMKIGGQAAIEALEAALGDDPCDDDGGCGIYDTDFFQYDLDGNGTIVAAEKFDTPGEAIAAIYAKYPLSALEDDTNYIGAAGTTHTITFTGVDGKTHVTVHTEAPTSVILVTLTDYPRDKHGENIVCVQHETWIVIPPPVIEKLPNILWAGEKDVIEWRLDVTDWDLHNQAVVFYLEYPSVGTFETLTPIPPDGIVPSPGFAYRDMAWGLVEYEICGDYWAARTVLHSDKQGKSNVIAQYLEYGEYGWGIVSQQGFLVYFLAFEEVELKNIEEDPTNDEAWELEGDELSDLYLDNSSKLRLRVKGWFEDPVMKSPKPEKPQDLDGDGTTDIILPAGRWVLPDDYPTLALGKLLWDMMDTPVDDIVSWLDDDADQVETLGLSDEILLLPLPAGVPAEVGAYGDGACFESPLYDATLTPAQRWAAYLEGVVSFGPVIGPFSKLEPVNDDGTGWAAFEDTTPLPVQPEVPADFNEIDDFTPELFELCRTTVVPDGLITTEDANMPPVEILFAITAGNGLLADVNKADLYQIPETCDTDTGVVYTNPYYWQEIPANLLIPPQYGSALAGYEWDSWGWGTDTTIDGPYRFWDERNVWTADELILMNIFDLAAVPTALKAYTDNHGEAWVEFTQKSFDFSTIEAVATYPYLIGDHLPLVSNPVVKISEDFKEVKVAWEKIDDMTDVLYIFVRDYDGDPAVCEEVEWTVDSPSGTIEALYEGDEGTSCVNECFDPDFTCIRDIAADSESATGCTREMTAAEITTFTGATISVPLDRFHRELGEPGELLFDPDADVPELPADYAIAGIRVISSLGDDVDILIKIHDCWDSVETIMPEDQILYFGQGVPGEPVEWNLRYGLDADLAAVNIWTYPAGAATVTLLDVDATMPDGLLIWHYSLADGWTFYKKGWGVSNTLTTLVPSDGYIGIVPTASLWEIPQA